MNFAENLEHAKNFAIETAMAAKDKAVQLASIAKANIAIYAEEDKIRKAQQQLGAALLPRLRRGRGNGQRGISAVVPQDRRIQRTDRRAARPYRAAARLRSPRLRKPRRSLPRRANPPRKRPAADAAAARPRTRPLRRPAAVQSLRKRLPRSTAAARSPSRRPQSRRTRPSRSILPVRRTAARSNQSSAQPYRIFPKAPALQALFYPMSKQVEK